MDVLWNPWRYQYIKGEGRDNPESCVFCVLSENPARDEENFILRRADFNFVVLNRFPYAAGHLLIVPYEHVSMLAEAAEEAASEMILLTKAAQAALADVYSPDGFNIGMNLGSAAGAGIAGHIHMHVVPRWAGDVNFLSSIGQTRNIPESLTDTYEKLLGSL